MTVRLLEGHVLDVLPALAAGSVSACITSPPYWGLRSYDTASRVWDAVGDCEHDWQPFLRPGRSGGTASAMVHSKGRTNFQIVPGREQATCPHCGAWWGELGSEPTPELFIAHLVAVLREVRRVLHSSGICLVNLGDTYYNNPGGQNGGARNGLDYGASRPSAKLVEAHGQVGRQDRTGQGHEYLKVKDLCLIPFRAAEALQRDGWYLRSVMPWVKRSALPESVRDRPTSAVEYWLLLTALPHYYWDGEAVRRSGSLTSHGGVGPNPGLRQCILGQNVHGTLGQTPDQTRTAGRSFRNSDPWFDSLRAILDGGGVLQDEDGAWLGLDIGAQPNDSTFCTRCERLYDGPELRLIRTWHDEAGHQVRECPSCKRTDVWLMHFAAFPPRLIVPLIQASTSEHGVCAACGAPWERVVERTANPSRAANVGADLSGGAAVTANPQTSAGLHRNGGGVFAGPAVTTNWQPTCRCPEGTPTRPAVVLDPFCGSGTTGLVSARLGRDFLGIDLNPAYLALARRRIEGDAPLLTTVEVG